MGRRLLTRTLGCVAMDAAGAASFLLTACSNEGAHEATAGPSSALPSSGEPALGAHALAYHRLGDSAPTLGVRLVQTRRSGSTLLICVGRGALSAHSVPTDNNANIFLQLGAIHPYALWPASGTALYACAQAAGGSGHGAAVSKVVVTDEVTLAVVEIADGGMIVDANWREVLADRPTTSAFVTTTGPALLVAWWWGDAGVSSDKTAVPDNGFKVIDSILREGALVQCAVAVRAVEAAGSYRTTWTATPAQGAQLWIAAVQKA